VEVNDLHCVWFIYKAFEIQRSGAQRAKKNECESKEETLRKNAKCTTAGVAWPQNPCGNFEIKV